MLLLYASIDCVWAVALMMQLLCLWCSLVWFCDSQQGDWMGIPFPFGLLAAADVSSYDFVAAPSKEIQWLGSVLTGIIFSVMVSKMIFSSICQWLHLCVATCKCSLRIGKPIKTMHLWCEPHQDFEVLVEEQKCRILCYKHHKGKKKTSNC